MALLTRTTKYDLTHVTLMERRNEQLHRADRSVASWADIGNLIEADLLGCAQ
ncbi:MAG: hypothetical protein LAO21_00040 [Acidobacteriia bacterium]|nr:hypothetical protein [Terriglobia bacterium]